MLDCGKKRETNTSGGHDHHVARTENGSVRPAFHVDCREPQCLRLRQQFIAVKIMHYPGWNRAAGRRSLVSVFGFLHFYLLRT
jgi:hypothetical protein